MTSRRPSQIINTDPEPSLVGGFLDSHPVPCRNAVPFSPFPDCGFLLPEIGGQLGRGRPQVDDILMADFSRPCHGPIVPDVLSGSQPFCAGRIVPKVLERYGMAKKQKKGGGRIQENPEYYERLGERLAAARNTCPTKAFHGTAGRARFARKLGVDPERYRKWEDSSPNRNIPLHLIPEVCRLTGHHPWYILTGQSGTMSPGTFPPPHEESKKNHG